MDKREEGENKEKTLLRSQSKDFLTVFPLFEIFSSLLSVDREKKTAYQLCLICFLKFYLSIKYYIFF